MGYRFLVAGSVWGGTDNGCLKFTLQEFCEVLTSNPPFCGVLNLNSSGLGTLQGLEEIAKKLAFALFREKGFSRRNLCPFFCRTRFQTCVIF